VNGYRWFDPHQPQTLQIATMLLYLNGVIGLVFGGFASALGFLILFASLAGAFGMANSKKWGYVLAVLAAVLPLIFTLANGLGGADLINLMFEIALVALLLHPMSRNYQKIWFS
jgi:hypothetical protein